MWKCQKLKNIKEIFQVDFEITRNAKIDDLLYFYSCHTLSAYSTSDGHTLSTDCLHIAYWLNFWLPPHIVHWLYVWLLHIVLWLPPHIAHWLNFWLPPLTVPHMAHWLNFWLPPCIALTVRLTATTHCPMSEPLTATTACTTHFCQLSMRNSDVMSVRQRYNFHILY